MMNMHNEQSKYIKKEMVLDDSVTGIKTLLLVDDENAILELCKLFLEQQGYTVLTADAPYAAIRIARDYSSKIHMLITDIMMPIMNGLELAEALHLIRPDMKCVFISGCSPETIFSPEMFNRSINFIQKPFRLKDFAEKIRNILNQ